LNRFIIILIIYYAFAIKINAQKPDALIQQGWAQLVIDNDSAAFHLFNEAFLIAQKIKDNKGEAEALFHMGIASYGASTINGLDYATKALNAYQNLEKKDSKTAMIGRSKCLILISTIKSREGKNKEAIPLCKSAMAALIEQKDTSNSLGIVLNLLGTSYKNLNQTDSANYFIKAALQQHIAKQAITYLPVAYYQVAEIELKQNNYALSLSYYEKGYRIADSTDNRQAQITTLIGLSNWYGAQKNYVKAEDYLAKAKAIGIAIRDKTFLVNVLSQQKKIKKELGQFEAALNIDEEKIRYQSELSNLEKDKIVKNLEIQFNVSEKDRQLNLIQKEKAITTLTNYLLWIAIACICIITIGIILFLRRINKRDKQLLQAKEALVKAIEAQKALKEQQMHNEIEFKESQLSALTFQMLQKNELLQELKDKISSSSDNNLEQSISKIINKSMNQDQDWTDFNAHFESINKNFYSRIKQAFPDISPNELKICALIKMNLSIKEMANILNISPDSVKTARYRLRKKLQLNTEDNLTDFILNLN
jgi:DNA-binding NarL/FixJ family response regulator